MTYLPPGRVKRVAVIGFGPAGIAAAKYLKAEEAFEEIVVFEMRDRPGGIWNATPALTSPLLVSPFPPLPESPGSGSGDAGDGGRMKGGLRGGGEGEGEILSPIYDLLETNIPKCIMAYHDKPFPDEAPLFPGHEAVRNYLASYARDVEEALVRGPGKGEVRYGTVVEDVERIVVPADKEEGDGADSESTKTMWRLTSSALSAPTEDRRTRIDEFDALVIANGHYSHPFIPHILNLSSFTSAYPGLVIHAQSYRHPPAPDSSVKKIVVIGAGISGVDIASQIASETQGRVEVLLSARGGKPVQRPDGSVTFSDPQAPPLQVRGVRVVPEIAEFIVPEAENGDEGGGKRERAVRFINGEVEEGIDRVIFATGYHYAYPFLENRTIEPPLVHSGERTEGLWQHIFWNSDATLSVLAVPSRIVPFVIASAQSALISRFLSGRLGLPPLQARRDWERERIRQRGGGRTFHVMGFPEDGAYINMLADLVDAGDRGEGGRGLKGPRWGDREMWIREMIPGLQKVVKGMSRDERKDVRGMEEVGFEFDIEVRVDTS